MKKLSALLLTSALITIAAPTFAENDVVLGAGWFNFGRSTKDPANFAAEWRGNYLFTGYGLRPVAGGQANTDGGLYGYAGLAYDWEFVPHWVVTPDLNVGLWREGSGIDMGGPVEFHEAIELDYRFDNNMKLGAQVSHTSNADIYDRNPGANTVMAVLSLPLGR